MTPLATPNEVVEALMTFFKKETKHITDKPGHTVQRSFLTYRWPKPDCSTGMINFRDKSSFRNPYAHLKSCYGKLRPVAKQEEILNQLYKDSREWMERLGGKIRANIQFRSLYEYEASMYGYIRLVLMNYLPISYVSDPDVCSFSRFNVTITPKTLQAVMIKLVGLV